MEIRLGPQLTRDVANLEDRLRRWTAEGRARIRRALNIICLKWHAEAVKRVPVDTSRLKQAIIHNVYADPTLGFVGEVGTNVKKYPVYLEFGTDRIAGGKVKDLGTSPEITDQQAIHMWPAKAKNAIGATSAKIGADGRLRDTLGKFVASGSRAQEQMPWLRPSFNSIREWALEVLNEALHPSK